MKHSDPRCTYVFMYPGAVSESEIMVYYNITSLRIYAIRSFGSRWLLKARATGIWLGATSSTEASRLNEPPSWLEDTEFVRHWDAIRAFSVNMENRSI